MRHYGIKIENDIMFYAEGYNKKHMDKNGYTFCKDNKAAKEIGLKLWTDSHGGKEPDFKFYGSKSEDNLIFVAGCDNGAFLEKSGYEIHENEIRAIARAKFIWYTKYGHEMLKRYHN